MCTRVYVCMYVCVYIISACTHHKRIGNMHRYNFMLKYIHTVHYIHTLHTYITYCTYSQYLSWRDSRYRRRSRALQTAKCARWLSLWRPTRCFSQDNSRTVARRKTSSRTIATPVPWNPSSRMRRFDSVRAGLLYGWMHACMYVYVFKALSVHVCTCVSTLAWIYQVCTYLYIYMYVCMYVCIYVRVQDLKYMYVMYSMYICVYIRWYDVRSMHLYIYKYVCICMYVCMYVICMYAYMIPWVFVNLQVTRSIHIIQK